MALILALETTTDICSVAIGDGRVVVEDTRVAKRLHNELVLGIIDQCVKAAEVELAQLSCVAFSAGPGSFTGVRIAASVAQGIALAWDLPVCAVATSPVMAASVVGMVNVPRFQTVRRSRQNLVYAAEFAVMDGQPTHASFDELVEDTDLSKVFAVSDKRVALSARHVAALAVAHPDRWVSAEQALPIYVDGDSPWQPAQAST